MLPNAEDAYRKLARPMSQRDEVHMIQLNFISVDSWIYLSCSF